MPSSSLLYVWTYVVNVYTTETALCSVLDEIVGSIDNDYTVALMSLDISAAFDAVSHDILIQRLEEEFGVTGRCCQWIASNLTGRSFSVRFGGRLPRQCRWQLVSHKNQFLAPCCTRCTSRQLVDWLPSMESTTMSTLMILSCSARCQYLLLDYYKIVLKHCNIDFEIMDCCLIQTNLPLIILAHMVDWGSLSYHHRLQQRTVVNVSDRLCLLGVTLDNTLSFNQHVNNIVKNCNYISRLSDTYVYRLLMKLLRWWLVLLLALELITVTHYFTEWLTGTWISYSVYKTKQPELFVVLKVSNFITCIGYPTLQDPV